MIKIICFGKLKENYLVNAVNDYLKGLISIINYL